VRDEQGNGKDDDKVDDQWRRNSDHGNDLVDDLTALTGEQHQNRVEQTNERPGRDVFEEHTLVPLGACNPLNSETCGDGSSEGDPKEHSNADCDC